LSIQAAEASWEVQETKLDALAEKYNVNLHSVGLYPGDQHTEDFKTCYVGKPDEAVGIAANLADSFYSDQLGYWGWKYKNTVRYEEDTEEDEINAILDQESPAWKNWKGNDESILLISHTSDDGDDVLTGIIVKCK
jgi:hypothetical protein